MRLEDLSVVAVLIFFGVAGSIPGIAPNQANEMTGAAATALQTLIGVGAQLVVNLIIAVFLVQHRQLMRQSAMLLLAPLTLTGWALASIAWSSDPGLTARRAIPFGMASAFAACLTLRFPQQRLLVLVRCTFLVLAFWSAVLALTFPAIGLDASTGHGGDWQGAFTQKNACGRAMVFAIAAMCTQRGFSTTRGIMLLLFVAELGFSGSRGAWLLGGVLLAALGMFRAGCALERSTRTAFFAVSIIVGSCLCGFGVAEFPVIAELIGRDPTLTGRTAIWHEVWLAIRHRPLLGYGFSAFWHGAQGASWDVVVALKFVLFHAHNGFLEIWLELGGAGLLLFLAGFTRALVLLWPEVRAGQFEEAAWPFSILLLVALYDIDENTLLTFNGLFWVLYCAVLVQLEVQASARRHVRAVLASVRPSPTSTGWIAPALASCESMPSPSMWLPAGNRMVPWLQRRSAADTPELSGLHAKIAQPRGMHHGGSPWL
ncbi:O-antigen ligase [Acidipila sp. EB88]|uniref:O-antigen ligase family protein n=1 Tax=Acidipila sp. EB88 TaxID=2305226 RepID=UPI001315180C|nr:O-antigen ligase family protein [Acidipila sp. EB88]